MISGASEDQFFEAKISSRKDIDAHLWILRLQPEQKLYFNAGQYATLGLWHAGKHVERAYSIVSSPDEDELEFFFELVPGGELTPLLHLLRVGDVVSVRKRAKGNLTLDTGSGHGNHLLLCTVTGVAPFVSFARALYHAWRRNPPYHTANLFIVTGGSHSYELAYREELQQYESEVAWLKFVATVSRPWEDPLWAGEVGRVEDVIRKYTDFWRLTPRNTTAYLCGHPQMIENGKGILARSGWKNEALREEIYFVHAAREQEDDPSGTLHALGNQ